MLCLLAGALTGACGPAGDVAGARPSVAEVPASIQIVAAPESLQVGQQGQVVALVRDGAGKALPAYPLVWASDAPDVAGVDSTGLVTAIAEGSADITAAANGRTAIAPLSVVSSLLLPPPDSTGDQTVGIVFADGFEGGYAGPQNGAGWQNTAPVNVAVSDDVAHSGRHSLRFRFPGKADCLDASAEQRFSLGRPMHEVWLEYYIYFPAGGEGGSAAYYHRWEYPGCASVGHTEDNNKFLAVFGPNYNGETSGIICTWTTTRAAAAEPPYPGDSRIQSAYSKAGMHGVMPNIANYDAFIRGPGDRGRWMQIRAHFRLADFGQANGVIQLWKDGSLILNNADLPWYDSTGQANYMTQGYLMGWSNSGFNETTNIYIDDFRIMDRNPGW